MTRRDALRDFAAFVAGSPLAAAQYSDPQPKMDEMVNVFDFEPACKTKVSKAAYEYVSGGAWDEWTLKRNRDAFGKITFRPRFFQPVDKMDLSTTILGQKLAMPIMVAPTGTHQLMHPEGEIATVKGAGAAGAAMAVSTSSNIPLDKIAAAAKTPLFFQLYTGPDREGTRTRVENAVGLGCKAILITVDGPFAAPREKDVRNRLESSPQRGPRRRLQGEAPDAPYGLPMRFQAGLDWRFLDELVAYAKVPVLVKGVLTPEDALLAAKHGAAGVVVSNHGGRYLDGAPSTIEVLPEIVDAVGAKMTVLIDGGFRRGTDVLKALAIGAKGVFVGRAPLWGLGAFGEPGVNKVMEILKKELAWAMGLAGRQTVAQVNRSLVRIDKF